jgi:hypothetical protein
MWYGSLFEFKNILPQPSSGVTYKDMVYGLDAGFIGHFPFTILDHNLQCGALANYQLQSIALSLFHNYSPKSTITCI